MKPPNRSSASYAWRPHSFGCPLLSTEPSSGASGRGQYPQPSAYRTARRDAIKARLEGEKGAEVQDGLPRRLAELRNAVRPSLILGPMPVDYFVSYDYTLAHPPGEVDAPGGRLQALAIEEDWHFRCRFGAWDADVLSGFASGSFEIPLYAAAGV